MLDLVASSFTYTDQLLAHASKVEKETQRALRRTRRMHLGLAFYAVVVTVLLLAALVALDAAVPAIRLVPMYFHTSEDGVTDAEVSTDLLPGDLPTLALQSWLWQYVMHREQYAWTTADYDHHVVMAMSSKSVGEAYDNWISGKNPRSPQNIYKQDAVVLVELREVTEWVPATKEQPGRITIHFARKLARTDKPRPEPEETYSITMEFMDHVDRGINIRDMMSFNPSRIVITSYPGVQSLAAMRETTQ